MSPIDRSPPRAEPSATAASSSPANASHGVQRRDFDHALQRRQRQTPGDEAASADADRGCDAAGAVAAAAAAKPLLGLSAGLSAAATLSEQGSLRQLAAPEGRWGAAAGLAVAARAQAMAAASDAPASATSDASSSTVIAILQQPAVDARAAGPTAVPPARGQIGSQEVTAALSRMLAPASGHGPQHWQFSFGSTTGPLAGVALTATGNGPWTLQLQTNPSAPSAAAFASAHSASARERAALSARLDSLRVRLQARQVDVARIVFDGEARHADG